MKGTRERALQKAPCAMCSPVRKACLLGRGVFHCFPLTHDKDDCGSSAPSGLSNERQRPKCVRGTGCSNASSQDTRAFISATSLAVGQAGWGGIKDGP